MTRILHISDLHISKAEFKDESVVHTHFDDDENFTDKLIKSINNNCKELTVDKIIVTGDLANKSEEEEYSLVEKFLNDLSVGIKVNKENILIIPGNHDINWGLSEGHYDLYKGKSLIKKQEISKKPYEFIEKYKYFSDFYNRFYETKKTFNASSKIVWHEVLDDAKLIVLGLNTNEQECHLPEYHYGYIDHGELKEEIKVIVEKYPNHKYAIFSHHIIASTNEQNKSIKNQLAIFNLLNNTYNISAFFCGHQHVGGGRFVSEEFANEFFTFGVGSLAKFEKKVQNSYCLLDFSFNDNSLKLKKTEIDFTPKGNQGQWSLPTINDYVIYSEDSVVSIPDADSQDIFANKEEHEVTQTIKTVDTSVSPRMLEYSNKMVQIIKENEYLKSGHFHWSPKSRTLGAINTSAMFSKFDHLSLCKSAIIDLIHENQLTPELIVGLGIEGSLLSANIASMVGATSSYCPYIIRKEHHLSHEIKLDFEGKKKIALITDVSHKGHTIDDLLKDNNELFKDIEEIYLISIFYTSKKEDYSPEVFKKYDDRIKVYTVCDKIKIDDCSYCDEVTENCIINATEFNCKSCAKSFNNCITHKDGLEPIFKYY